MSWNRGLSVHSCTFINHPIHGGRSRSGFLEQMLPGFQWLTPRGFVIGLVEAFLYGGYTGLVFTPIYNAFHKRWATG